MSSLDDKLATAKAKVPDTYNAGKSCKDLTDFSYFFTNNSRNDMWQYVDTRNGTKFIYMFDSCTSLTKEKIPLLDTSKGLRFDGMFRGCNQITSIPLLDTSKGEIFNSMFERCSNLTSIPILNTSKGGHFVYMFRDCGKLMTVPALDVSNGINFNYMFYGCSKLAVVPKLNTAKGTQFIGMFTKCTELTTVSFTIIKASISFSDSPKLDAFTLRGIVNALEVKTIVSSSYKLTLNATSWDLLENDSAPPTGYNTWKEYITNYKKWTYA